MGAGRLRIARQLLTESVVLSLAGGALGLLLAFWGVDALRTFVQDEGSAFTSKIPRGEDIGINTLVLTFSLALSLVTGIVFGLFPALHAAKGDLNNALKEAVASAPSGALRAESAAALVVWQWPTRLCALRAPECLASAFSRLRAFRSA